MSALRAIIPARAAQRTPPALLLPEPSALHLTRRADLLELELPLPDLSLYDPPRRTSR